MVCAILHDIGVPNMAETKTVFSGSATNMFEFNEKMTEARLLMMLTKSQLALIYDLVRERLPASVRIDMRSAKGNVQLTIAGTVIDIFHINNRAKMD